VFAPYGTPVVAPVGGSVADHDSGLGGKGFWLRGSDGNTYYGAHLSRFGATGPVRQGQIVGYVGTSGNARGGPAHLHFEIHPGGGGPVNPYGTLRAYC
jgi:murein DD-endopeptidase MepM/ murein hydrolase activator NlpD